MAHMLKTGLAIAALAVVLAFGGFPSQSALAQIGVASVVKNDVSGSRGGSTRVLRVGTSIFQNETVSTGENSSAQLLFLDETSMTLGSNSSLTLNRFVYDPRAKSGNIAVSIGKGAFRFVTGSADPRSYTIKTPVATLGIRGTILEGYLSALTGTLVLVVVEGIVDVELSVGTIITLTEGQSLTIDSNGNVVSGPKTWTGPTLVDPDTGFRFVFDDQGNLLNEGGDVLPQWQDLNDALDSRDLDITFPPDPTDPPDKPMDKPQMDYQMYQRSMGPTQSLGTMSTQQSLTTDQPVTTKQLQSNTR